MGKHRLWRFSSMLTSAGWLTPAFVCVDEQGRVVNYSSHPPQEHKIDEEVKGWLIPGFQNAHSHAFQFAMVGLAEQLPNHLRQDDFWSWRESMYEVALTIGPEELQAIATMVYSEMMRVGYTWVAEFHYLHHDPEGKVYAQKDELAQRLIQAAKEVGMGLTLLPMYYNRGGFKRVAEDRQRRFVFLSVDAYAQYHDYLRGRIPLSSRIKLGGGVHSLRAARSREIEEVFKLLPVESPKHIHIAEQLREVQECQAHWGKRPVQWLVDHIDLDSTYNLVHATHIDSNELRSIISSQSQVVICPSTEGNLGDGFFPIEEFHRQGGHWSIGTDSHVGLSPLEELRWLDYGARILSHKRNPFCQKGGDDSGSIILKEAYESGRRAMGFKSHDFFKVGEDFDGVVMSDEEPLILDPSHPSSLSTLIYGRDPCSYLGVISSGQWRVKEGQHLNAPQYRTHFRRVLKKLGMRSDVSKPILHVDHSN